MAYLAAAHCPIDVAIAYYGTDIQNFLDEAPKIACPTILHIGEKDHTTPPGAIRKIVETMKANPHVTTHVYPDAPHAFCNVDRADTYRPALANKAHQRTFDLMKTVARQQ